jgi:hypothetical protein
MTACGTQAVFNWFRASSEPVSDWSSPTSLSFQAGLQVFCSDGVLATMETDKLIKHEKCLRMVFETDGV